LKTEIDFKSDIKNYLDNNSNRKITDLIAYIKNNYSSKQLKKFKNKYGSGCLMCAIDTVLVQLEYDKNLPIKLAKILDKQ